MPASRCESCNGPVLAGRYCSEPCKRYATRASHCISLRA